VAETPAQVTAPEPAPAVDEPPPTPLDTATWRAATLRFRRGSRGIARTAEIPLVGVVKIEPDAVAERPKTDGRPKPKAEGRKPKAAKAKAASGRGRGRGKAKAPAATPE